MGEMWEVALGCAMSRGIRDLGRRAAACLVGI